MSVNMGGEALNLDLTMPILVYPIREFLPSKDGEVDDLLHAVGWRASLRVVLQTGGPSGCMASWYIDTPLVSIQAHRVLVSRRVSPVRFQREAFSLAASFKPPVAPPPVHLPWVEIGHHPRVISHIPVPQAADGTARERHLHYQVLQHRHTASRTRAWTARTLLHRNTYTEHAQWHWITTDGLSGDHR